MFYNYRKMFALTGILLVGIIGLVLAAGKLYKQNPAKNPTTHTTKAAYPGYLAPDFSLVDLKGKKVSMADYSGKVLLIDFWATWCPPCRMSIPKLQELFAKYKDKGFNVVGINMDTDESAVPGFVKERGLTYDILLGGNSNITDEYNVMGLPAFYLVSRGSKISNRWIGYYPGLEKEWNREIEKLLAS